MDDSYESKDLELSNPEKFQEIFSIPNNQLNLFIKLFKSMLLIRRAEEKLAEQKEAGNIKGPVHLGAGQEAVAVRAFLRILSQQIEYLELTDLTHIFLQWKNVYLNYFLRY